MYNCGNLNPSNPQDRPDICTPVSGAELEVRAHSSLLTGPVMVHRAVALRAMTSQ